MCNNKAIKVMNYTKSVQIILCAMITTILTLTLHIFVTKTIPELQKYLYNITSETPPNYRKYIIFVAYITAFVSMIFTTVVYYYSQHFITIRLKILKIFFIAFIILGLNQCLFRGPIMDILLLVHHKLEYHIPITLLRYLNPWLTTLSLISSIILFCPTNDHQKC